jgi:ADP-heptose:LPS heptosyltransferase
MHGETSTADRAAPRLLFLPVSGPLGMGEYVRSLAIAGAAVGHWPRASVHFALSREAPYAADSPFPRTLLPSSPTFHTLQVVALIEELRPDVVVFDNAGRTAQLRAARRVGAAVVYVSARPRQRRKAFRWRWLSLIDEHWLAYPEFLSGPLTPMERLKLRWMHRAPPRYLDVILPASDPALNAAVLERFQLTPKSFVLFVPGGGTGHPGARDAVGVFAKAAQALAATGVPTLLVAAARASGSAAPGTLRTAVRLPLDELTALMRQARVVVSNGGSTLLQAIACQAPCIAAAIAKDQGERIRRCARARVVLPVPLDARAVAALATALMGDETARTALIRQAANLNLADGLQVALTGFEALLDRQRVR